MYGLSEISDNKDKDDNRNSAKDNKCDGDGDGEPDRNTGAGGRSAEWLRFLSLSAKTEALGTMAKAKAYSLISSIKTKSGID